MPVESLIAYVAAAFSVGAAATFAASPVAAAFARRAGAMDRPVDSRRMHTDILPRAGGLALFLALALVSAAFPSEVSAPLVAGGAIACALGITDDIFSLSPALKLLGQLAAASLAVSLGVVPVRYGLYFGSFSLPPVLSALLGVLWIVTLMNAVNFIDGLDGLAAGTSGASFLTLALALLAAGSPAALSAAVLAGACIGFLPVNRAPARMFLGDCGSLLLGYSLGVLTLTQSTRAEAMLLLVSLPLFDLILSVVRRLAAGKSPLAADRGHIHHRLIDSGYSVRVSVYTMVCVTLCTCFLAAALLGVAGIGAAVAAIALVLVGAAHNAR